MNAATPPDGLVPTIVDVRAAARRLSGIVHRTPVMTSTALDHACGARVFLKCENLQRVGAFKLRGAYNFLAQLPRDRLERGVTTFSAGNHGQGVALAARELGTNATIVMPDDAPDIKVAATRGYGATVVAIDWDREDGHAVADRLADERGLTVVPPFDHPWVIAGQGTVALELVEQVDEPLDMFLSPLGGG
ncbi:MAG: pyridoxal-phosphate dependent enzyme, partial [Chloroflexota bacterium]|nr:pyridoxal-phosphate dependent enzyme [Chloroflexota bacterium]